MQYKVGLGYSLYSYTVLIFHLRNLTVTHALTIATLIGHAALNVCFLLISPDVHSHNAAPVLLSGNLPADILLCNSRESSFLLRHN